MRIEERQERAVCIVNDVLDQFKIFYLSSLSEVVYENQLKDSFKDGANETDGKMSKSRFRARRSRSLSDPGLSIYSNSRPSLNSRNEDSVKEKRKSRVMEVLGNAFSFNHSSSNNTSNHSNFLINTSNFSTKIISSQAVEIPSGTYIVYVILSKLDEEESVIFRRFKEFKELHAFLKKKEPNLPQTVGCKLESKNLRSEMIASRSQLLAEYLKVISDSPEVRDIKELQLWLGLGKQRDEVLSETFRRAYYRLRCACNLWKKSIYNHNMDAIYRLICDKIKRDVFSELDRNEHTPHREIAKLKEAYKEVTSDLQEVVDKFSVALNKEAMQVRAQVSSALENNMLEVQKLEKIAKKNAKALIIEIFKSAWPKVEDDLKLITNELQEPIKLTLLKLTHYQILNGSLLIPVNFDSKIIDVLIAATPEKIDEFEKLFNRLKQALKSHLTIQLAFALPPIIEKLKIDTQTTTQTTTQTESEQFLDAIRLLPDILSALIDVTDPASFFITIRQILDCKYALLQEHPVNIRRIEDIIDRYEQFTQDKIWWTRWEVLCAGYSSYYDFWERVGNAGPYADLYKNFLNEVDVVHKKVLTKLSHKFGDMIIETIQREVRDWKGAIDDAILGAYTAAKKSAVKHIRILFKRLVVNIIKAGIKAQVQEMVIGPVGFVQNVQLPQALPLDSLDQVKGQDRIYEQVFEDLLNEHIVKFVDNVSSMFIVEFDKEIAP